MKTQKTNLSDSDFEPEVPEHIQKEYDKAYPKMQELIKLADELLSKQHSNERKHEIQAKLYTLYKELMEHKKTLKFYLDQKQQNISNLN